MFGYSADEIIGKSIRLLIPDDRQQEEDEVLSQIRRGERVEHYETIRQRKDGTRFPVSLTVSPIRTTTASSSARQKSHGISAIGSGRMRSAADCSTLPATPAS